MNDHEDRLRAHGECIRAHEESPTDYRQLYCNLPCTIRAADRRRRGLPIASPGYKPKPRNMVAEGLDAAKKLLDRAAKKARTNGLLGIQALLFAVSEAKAWADRAKDHAYGTGGQRG